MKILTETQYWPAVTIKKFVAIEQEKIVGSVSVWIRDGNSGENDLSNMYVHQDFRRRGIARTLLMTALNDRDVRSQVLWLKVDRAEEGLIKFYRSERFKVCRQTEETEYVWMKIGKMKKGDGLRTFLQEDIDLWSQKVRIDDPFEKENNLDNESNAEKHIRLRMTDPGYGVNVPNPFGAEKTLDDVDVFKKHGL